jgi:hypothetical protein
MPGLAVTGAGGPYPRGKDGVQFRFGDVPGDEIRGPIVVDDGIRLPNVLGSQIGDSPAKAGYEDYQADDTEQPVARPSAAPGDFCAISNGVMFFHKFPPSLKVYVNTYRDPKQP